MIWIFSASSGSTYTFWCRWYIRIVYGKVFHHIDKILDVDLLILIQVIAIHDGAEST